MVKRALASVVALVLVAGCGDEGGASGSSTGGSAGTTGGTGAAAAGGSGGTGAVGEVGGSGGTGGTGGTVAMLAPCGPEASENAQGVLTSHPAMMFDVGDPDFELETLNIVPSTAPSGIDTLNVYGELTNVGTETRCFLFFDARLDGMEVLVQAEMPPLKEDGYTTTQDCLPPGQTAILVGLQNDIPAATVNAATTFELNMTSMAAFGPLAAALDGPTVEATIEEGTSGGNRVVGTITPNVSSWNYGMRFYPRDSRGLIVDELLAFPGSLGDLVPGVSLDFETLESECQFDEYVFVDSWIYN